MGLTSLRGRLLDLTLEAGVEAEEVRSRTILSKRIVTKYVFST